MKANVIYLTYRNHEPLMEGLGFQRVSVEPFQDINGLLKKLQKQGAAIVYVSEAVYADAKHVIDSWAADALAISVLSPNQSESNRGASRLKGLLHQAVGIQKG